MELYKKYLKEAEKLYNEGNLPQAGEKYYRAVAELLKMIGKKRKWKHKGHKLRDKIIIKLNDEYINSEILQKKYPKILNLIALYDSANRLHQNFYENDLDKKRFDERRENVLLLISYLEDRILEPTNED